jgi:hypothetical protein
MAFAIKQSKNYVTIYDYGFTDNHGRTVNFFIRKCWGCEKNYQYKITFMPTIKVHQHNIKCKECNRDLTSIYASYEIEIKKLTMPEKYNDKISEIEKINILETFLNIKSCIKVAKTFERPPTQIYYIIREKIYPFLEAYNQYPVNRYVVNSEFPISLRSEENKRNLRKIIKGRSDWTIDNKIIKIIIKFWKNIMNSESFTIRHLVHNKRYISISWLDYVANKNNVKILHFINNKGEAYKIPHTRYKVDGFDKINKTIYEYYECYAHGCPKCSDSLTAKEKYEKTLERKDRFINLGYKVVEMWGCKWNKIMLNKFLNGIKPEIIQILL